MYSKHQIIPRGASGWDNSGNNKAYQSQQVAFVYDGTSIYSYLLTSDTELAQGPDSSPRRRAPAGGRGTLYRLLRRVQGEPVPGDG